MWEIILKIGAFIGIIAGIITIIEKSQKIYSARKSTKKTIMGEDERERITIWIAIVLMVVSCFLMFTDFAFWGGIGFVIGFLIFSTLAIESWNLLSIILFTVKLVLLIISVILYLNNFGLLSAIICFTPLIVTSFWVLRK